MEGTIVLFIIISSVQASGAPVFSFGHNLLTKTVYSYPECNSFLKTLCHSFLAVARAVLVSYVATTYG